MAGGNPSVNPGVGAVPFLTGGFYIPSVQPSRQSISGVTRDSGGSPLGNCVVDVYDTKTDIKLASIVSDLAGNYSIEVTGAPGLTFYVVAYKAGSPDVAGTTVNTLTALPS